MVEIFLAPAGNYLRSVSEGVKLSEFAAKLSDTERAQLPLISSGGRLRLWGCHLGAVSFWNVMQPDDVVLFILKGSSFYTEYGKVALKSHNPALAEEMKRVGYWPGPHYEYIFFLKDHKSVRVSKPDINRIRNWGPSVPQRFMRVASPEVRKGIFGMLEDAARSTNPPIHN